MNDLVQRLRSMCGNDPNTICTQAADEIENLRGQIGAYQLHEKQLLAAKQGLECKVESLRSTINEFHYTSLQIK